MLPNWLYGKSKSKLATILGDGDTPADYNEVKAQVTQNTEGIEELTKIVTTPFKIAKTDCYCENDTAIHTYTPAAIAGYKPVGIVGLSAIGDFATVNDLYEYRLYSSGDNLSIRVGWKTAFSTTKGIRVMILYVSETSGVSFVSQ